MAVDTQVRPAIFVGQERMRPAPAPDLARWERDLIERLALDRAYDIEACPDLHPDETISGSGDGWDDCDYMPARG
ncbi:hypothetical protein [Microbispora sp. ATCC PTA-5024]|uniref:hypothetical protein n=1 Tax=Microbispora sp. ATCC PTA-5024 TaxID=316330 RepID=UPI0003DD4B75|nr:hypothetical protein [Microbispora sp. ATCC PTA-5024]ETK31314.1 hypothetical protein MPTA5024_35390 [Microbispora sp. ATCC PTA-5024]